MLMNFKPLADTSSRIEAIVIPSCMDSWQCSNVSSSANNVQDASSKPLGKSRVSVHLPSQMRYHEGGLFEFILNVADEFGSSVRTRSDTVPIPGFDEVDAQVRHIVQPICEAIIRALKFLRQRVEQKIEPQSKDGQREPFQRRPS